MSERQPPECERVERFEIVIRPSALTAGRNEYKREDGTIVHGDASREWTLDESGGMRTLCSSRLHVRWATAGRPSSGTSSPPEVLGCRGLAPVPLVPAPAVFTRAHARARIPPS